MPTLIDLIDEVVASDPDREAYVHSQADGTTRRLTFAERAAHADGLGEVLVVLDELPLTPVGKVAKTELQPLAAREAQAWSR